MEKGAFLISCGFILCLGMTSAVDIQHVYHHYPEMTKVLQDLEKEFPEMLKLITIGKSVQDRELWVMQIGKNPTEHQLLMPEVKYVANMHGNEVIGREAMLHFIKYLMDNYESDDNVKKLLDNTRVHIMPSMNPDGFEASLNNQSDMGNCFDKLGRNNSNNINLNRNFPDYFEEYENVIQPETQAVIDWMKEQQFALSANLHGGALLVNFPYDNYYARPGAVKGSRYAQCDDDDVFIHLSQVYSENHARMRTNVLCYYHNSSFPGGITNGADWYYVIGGMQDYNYIYAGVPEVTLELSCCKYPQEAELEGFWEENIDSLLLYLLEGLRGVKGIVKDKKTGDAIKGASVTFEKRERHPLKTTHLGEYWKILLSGKYKLMVRADGYKDFHKDFTVKDELVAVRVDAEMEKLPGADCNGSVKKMISMATVVLIALIRLF